MTTIVPVNKNVNFGKKEKDPNKPPFFSTLLSSTLDVAKTAAIGTGVGFAAGYTISRAPMTRNSKYFQQAAKDVFATKGTTDAAKEYAKLTRQKRICADVLDIANYKGKAENFDKYVRSIYYKWFENAQDAAKLNSKEIMDKLYDAATAGAELTDDFFKNFGQQFDNVDKILSKEVKEFITKADKKDEIFKLAKKTAKEIRNSKIIGMSIAVSCIGYMAIHLLKSFGVQLPKIPLPEAKQRAAQLAAASQAQQNIVQQQTPVTQQIASQQAPQTQQLPPGAIGTVQG